MSFRGISLGKWGKNGIKAQLNTPIAGAGLSLANQNQIKTRLKSKVFSLEILILLIWTNVPRTNVAWKNVVVTVVICCICYKDPLFKV